jgi:transcriptional regulator with PAS, ATPase and Fis domain
VAHATPTEGGGIDPLNYGIVGSSPAIASLVDYLPKVARSRATVLITGETGTGKERVAQAIHALSARAARRFVVINCGALPDSLIESELFGHARGAFTGAVEAAKGRLIEAHGGTLFLDEIGEMSLYAQAKLLRVLETQEVQPLGGAPRQSVDVRIIAATNRDLEQAVALQNFRADLFYRLNVARILIPPLRDRPGDVALLAAKIIAEFNLRDATSVEPPEPALMAALAEYDWPGNVRELRNLIEAVFIDPPRGCLGFEHLPPAFAPLFGRYRRSQPSERLRVMAALKRSNGNKAEAAKALNWSRMTLYRKLAKYDVGRPNED